MTDRSFTEIVQRNSIVGFGAAEYQQVQDALAFAYNAPDTLQLNRAGPKNQESWLG
jgi:hypothetical protein